MISNQDTVFELKEFFISIIELAERLGIEFDPYFIMINSSDETYNSVIEVPNVTKLMCYFHVMKNVKKNFQKPLSIE